MRDRGHRRLRLLLAARRTRGTRSSRRPYGAPSGPLTLGTLAGRDGRVRAAARAVHRFAPHVVPYRANLWALRTLGVRQVVSLSAVGSLTTSLPTGTLVVPDQLADRTHGRAHTFFDAGDGRRARDLRRPVLPARARRRGRRRRGARRRHAGRGQRAALLVAGRVAGVPVARLVDHRHDRDARGGPGPRAGALLHHARARHRPRRRRRGRDRVSRTPRCSSSSRPTCRACGRCSSSTLERLPAEQGDCPCGDTSGYPASFLLP